MNAQHMDTWAMEREWDRGTARWEKWMDRLKKATGIANLDGDSDVDGYSLDECHGIFMCDASVADAAATIRRRIAETKSRSESNKVKPDVSG